MNERFVQSFRPSESFTHVSSPLTRAPPSPIEAGAVMKTEFANFLRNIKHEIKNTTRRKLPNSISKIVTPHAITKAEKQDLCAIISEYKRLLYEERTENRSLLIFAKWDFQKSKINAPVKPYFNTTLQLLEDDENDRTAINSLEVLRLLEMTKLQLCYQDIRFSVQRTYHIALNADGINAQQYRILRHLFIRGYKLCVYKNRAKRKRLGSQHRKNESTCSTPKPNFPRISKLKPFSPISHETNVVLTETNCRHENLLCGINFPNYVAKTDLDRAYGELNILRLPTKVWDLLPSSAVNNFAHFFTEVSIYKSSISMCSIKRVHLPTVS